MPHTAPQTNAARETGHTPGPWIITEHDHAAYILPTGDVPCITIIALERMGRNYTESKANADLVAAAPDLLASMEDLFEQCFMTHKHWGDGSNRVAADASIANARAAIAKAKGTR